MLFSFPLFRGNWWRLAMTTMMYTTIVLILIFCIVSSHADEDDPLFRASVIRNASLISKVTEMMYNGDFEDALSGLEIIESPFTSLIGPALSMIVQNSTSDETNILKKILRRTDRNFQMVHREFNNIKQKFDELRIQIRLGYIEQKIRVAAYELRLIHRVPPRATSHHINLFIMNYEGDFQNSAKKLYDSIIDKHQLFHKDLFHTTVPLVSYNRHYMQLFMMDVMKLLLQGIHVELSYLYLKNYTASYDFMKKEWSSKIHNVLETIQKIDNFIKGRWRIQAEIDVDEILKTYVNMNHYNVAHAIYNHLKHKHFWRHWLVIVYDPVKGDQNHWMSSCGGYIKFNHFGRNIIISSVDENKPPIREDEAKHILNSIPPQSSADSFYSSLPNNIKNSCSPYASAGCLRYGVNGHHVGMKQRTVYVPRDDSNFTLHLFG